MLTYDLDGVALDDPDGRWKLRVGTAFRSSHQVTWTSVTVPGRPGEILAMPGRLEPSSLPVSARIYGATDLLQEQRLRALESLLPLHRTVPLGRSVDGERHVAEAVVESRSEVEHHHAGNFTDVAWVLRLPAGIWRSPTFSETTWEFSENRSNLLVPSLYGITAPVDDAIIRVRGSLSSITVTDVVSGTAVSWGGSLAEGQYVYLSAADFTAWMSSSASAWSGGADVSGGLDYPAAGMLRLTARMWEGDPMDRRPIVNLTGSGRSGQTEVTIRARGAYL